MEWEGLLIYGPGNWTRAEILKTPAREVFQHLILSRRASAQEHDWSIKTSMFHRMNKKGQRKVIASIKRRWHFGLRMKRATELVDGDTRILMIGSELTVHGEKWAIKNSDELRWLHSQGISPAEAMRRHQAWLEQERQHPFWTPAKKR